MSVEIGIIGGSGIYSLINVEREMHIDTRYGKTSDAIALGRLGGVEVAFLSRHTKNHTIPPHKVPYRANIDALSQIGVKRVIATGAVGSLKPDYRPGELAIFDQFANLTHGRHDTFFDEDTVAHISAAEPYCPQLRSIAIDVAKREEIPIHETGTVAVINGPRFSTRAESRTLSSHGYHMINMTQYPEVILARERQMCYLGIGLITDYDAGLEGRPDIASVSIEQIIKIFGQNIEKAKRIIEGVAKNAPMERSCSCSRSLDGAIMTHK